MKKLFAFIISLLTLGIADVLHAQEEVWQTYELADLFDYGYTIGGIPKGNENKFLLVVDSFALTGHNIVVYQDHYEQDHKTVFFTKIDQKYKDKIITRVSVCKEDSLPREYSFIPNKDRESWMIVDSMVFNDTTLSIVETYCPPYLERYSTCDGSTWGGSSCYEITYWEGANGIQPRSYLGFKKHEYNRSWLSGSYNEHTYNYICGQYYAGIPYPMLVATTGDGVPIRVYQRVNEPCCNEVSGVKVVQLDSTGVSVVWNEAHPQPAIGYKIVIETKDHVVIKEDTISGDLTAYSYKGLQEYTDYILSVTSVCGKEFASDSIPIRFRTKLTYCRSVSNVISEPQKSDVSLKWTSPVLRDDYPNIFYRVAITGENGFSMRQEVTDTQSKPFCPDYTCLPSNTSYTYAITTVCDDNFISDTVIGQFTTLPCGVAEPIRIYDEYNYARLVWSCDPVFSGYHVRLTASDTDMQPIIDKDVNNNCYYEFKELSSNTTYTYEVTPYCVKGGFGTVSTGEFTTLPCLPVTGVQIEPGQTDVKLSWSHLEPRPYRYMTTIFDSLGKMVNWWQNDDPYASFYRLEPNTTYQYSITTRCSTVAGSESEPATGSFTTLPCPSVSNIRAEAGLTDVKLSWDKPASEPYGYRVILIDEAGTTVTDSTATANPFSYSNLEPNTTYRYSIAIRCTENSAGVPVTGEFSTQTCLSVSNIRTEAGLTNVKLSWDSPASEPYGYRVILTDEAGTTVTDSIVSTNPFSYSKLEPNTTYKYSVSVKCTETILSEPVTGEFTTLPCPSVSNVRATVGLTDVKLSWDKLASEPYYQVFLTDEAGKTVAGSSAITNPFSWSRLEPNTTYRYSIAVRCTENSVGEPITGEFTTLPCPSVSNVRTEAGLTDVRLSWDSPVSEPYGYRVVLTDEAGTTVTEITATTSLFSYSKLEPNTTYRYSIAIRCTENSAGELVTGEFITQTCLSVSNVRTEAGLTDVRLSWDSPASKPYGYRVILTDEAGTTVAESTVSTSLFSYSKLEPNTTYRYSIAIRCTENSSGEPVTGEFTTQPCGQVSNVQTEVGMTDVFFTWEGDNHYARVVLTDPNSGDTLLNEPYAYGSYAFGSLEPNTTYLYSIAIRCTENSSGEPVTGEFTTQPCGQVSNVQTAVGMTDIYFTWEADNHPACVVLTEPNSGDTLLNEPYAYGSYAFGSLEPNTTYLYSIAIRCTENSSGGPVTGEFTTQPCGQVSNVQTEVGMTDVFFTWEADGHPAHVVLTEPNSGDTLLNEPYAYGSYAFGSLEPNTTYLYSIAIRCTENSSGEPVTGEFTTQPCGQVSNVQTEVGMTDVLFTWEADDHPAHVVLTEPNSGDTLLNDPFAYDSYAFSGLEPNATYLYSIALKCTENSSGEPVTGEFTTLSCGQVSNVNITAGKNSVKLSWTSPEPEHAGYNVTLTKRVMFNDITVISQDVNRPTFSYNKLSPNTSYRYSITVKCADGILGDPVSGSFKTLDDVSNTIDETLESVQIYPNPNTGEAVVETAEPIRMEIFSSNGILVETKDLPVGKQVVRFASKGIFMIRLSNTSGIATKRIVVL